MDTTHTLDSAPLHLSCLWTVKQKVLLPISRREIWHPVLTRKNIFTNYGLSALASAISGSYVPPSFLALESNYVTVGTPGISPGATSVKVSGQIDQAGDTQIVLGVGLATQEVVTFSSYSSGTYTLTTPTLNGHNTGEAVTRQVLATDTMSNIANEQQYDPSNVPNTRIQSIAGYSGGVGNWTIQFYLSATTANFFISSFGLADSATIGQGNLHNHVILGFDNTAGASDLEIDGNLTLTN